MSHYYDPWFHAFHLFVHRLLLFIALSVALSAGAWCTLLDRFYGSTALVALHFAWNIVRGQTDKTSVLLLALTVASSALFVATIFAALICSGRLRRGDAHRRGTRVLDHTQS